MCLTAICVGPHLCYQHGVGPGILGNSQIDSLSGTAGQFTLKQLAILADCMPGGIKYEEVDGKVSFI